MTAYLGNDCDGRPLYAGDRVTVIRADEHASHLIGREFMVRGESQIFPGRVEIDEPCEPCPHLYWTGNPDALRKLDPPADWDEVRRVTGWRPEREEETV